MLYRSFATFTKQWPGPSFAVASPAVAKLVDYVDASIGMPFDAVVSAMVGDTQRLRFTEVKDFRGDRRARRRLGGARPVGRPARATRAR